MGIFKERNLRISSSLKSAFKTVLDQVPSSAQEAFKKMLVKSRKQSPT